MREIGRGVVEIFEVFNIFQRLTLEGRPKYSLSTKSSHPLLPLRALRDGTRGASTIGVVDAAKLRCWCRVAAFGRESVAEAFVILSIEAAEYCLRVRIKGGERRPFRG